MALVARVAKVLGPRNLMPNPKMGTVTNDVTAAIEIARKGQVEFRAEKQGLINVPIGKVSFPAAKISENFKAVLAELNAIKPKESVGVFMRQATLKSTQGPLFFLDVDAPPFVAKTAAVAKQ